MANFNEILNHILGVVFIIIVFSLAYAYLKPHQLHKRRLVSTLLLKVSYLLYLLDTADNCLSFSTCERRTGKGILSGLNFLLSLIVLFVPTIGIFARKLGQFSKKREGYNYFFTVVNVLSIIVNILLMLFYHRNYNIEQSNFNN